MKENLKDILSGLNNDVDQSTLLLYLQGKLNAEQQHELEKQILSDDFNSEALEGLENFGDKRKITAVVEQLNRDLQKKTNLKKAKRKKFFRFWI